MNWFKDLLPLIGVILGSLITFIVQSRLLRAQRGWHLDNQKREWRRNRLIQSLDSFRQYQEKATIFSISEITQDSKNAFYSGAAMPLLSFDLFEDNELKLLHDKFAKYNGVFNDYMNSLPENDSQIEKRTIARNCLFQMADTLYEIQKRIFQLTEETFN